MPAFFVFDHEVIDLGQCAASLVQVLNTSKNVTVIFKILETVSNLKGH